MDFYSAVNLRSLYSTVRAPQLLAYYRELKSFRPSQKTGGKCSKYW